MLAFKTIELDEIETEVAIDFSYNHGEVQITNMTDVVTGDAICPDLLDADLENSLIVELTEYTSDLFAEKSYTKYNYQY
ncbi:MAG TPA: hypothetical protein VGN20_20650 [Mucilaginibacter sp.]|jgi:hypothetical protein